MCPGMARLCFSALQRAENSSMSSRSSISCIGIRFSALQRAENSSIRPAQRRVNKIIQSFSALQRAENSSMVVSVVTAYVPE